MTTFDPIPIPPDLGQCLAFPGLYLEPPAGMPAAAAGAGHARRGVGRKMAARVAVLAVAGLSVIGCAGGARAATVTPAAEWHACHLAVRVHEHRLQRVTVPRGAYVQAWGAADRADAGLRADIHRYLRTDRGWVAVVRDCNPDGWS